MEQSKLRKCVICGQEFIPYGSQLVCNGKHYRKCAVCGKEFEYNRPSDKRKTCSEECRALLRKQTIVSKVKTCKICGNKFTSESSTALYCKGPHYRTCPICGKEFELDLTAGLDHLPETCSPKCGCALAKIHWKADPEGYQQMLCDRLEKYKQTNLERYGVPFAHQTEEAREYFRAKTIETQEKRKQTNLERYGVPYAQQSKEIRQQLSVIISSKANQEKMKATMQKRYGVDYAMQSPDLARLHSGSQFKQIACDGTKVDSRWEALIYDFLKRNGIDFEYNTYSIPFEYKGKQHITHIDFKIGDLLLEVKGSHLLNGAYESSGLVIPISKKLELYRKHHVVVVTDQECANMFGRPNSKESNGLKYLHKCPEPLIGVDIDLFDHPVFPYRDDRPPCFYNVKVDGNDSAFEAFYNEQVRWKMILNRINYTGGFIDNKQILTAMNVTRTCKQPSWFSKSLAKHVIETYCTSDIIVDSFAGWGMRYDACIELGKHYVGLDFNKELVEWHQSKGRDIQFGDANVFTFDSKCSVFICPPYSDPKTGRCFEDYNFEGFNQSAKALSQCDWLRIIMNNVPNAAEYVMVCKIVDEDFKKYIVETIKNTSHFGTNNEYVLVVPGNIQE